MPHESSRLPSNMLYSAIGADTLCIAEAKNNPDSFCSTVKSLMFRMIKQGAHNDKLSNDLKLFGTKIELKSRIKLKMLQNFCL